MPIVGTPTRLVTVRATSGGIDSSTMAKAPACSSATASSTSASASCGSDPRFRVAAELVHRLRLQAEMAHDRNADVDEPAHDVEDRSAAFELHRRGAALCSSRPAFRTASATLT